MVSAVGAFLSSPWGRRIALIGGLLVGIWLLSVWHGREKHDFWQASFNEGRQYEGSIWRGKLQAAEAAARDTIRRKEEAAYRRGIDDEAKRRAADAADAEKTETIIREVTHASPSAASCRFDDPAVAGLNSLRRGQD